MKIRETERITGAPPAQEHAARDVVTAPERAGRTLRDTTSIMGIPAEELSPRVQQAVTTLMAEVDQLKRDLENSKKRLRETEDMADQDPLLPMLNRRAFVRELDRVISLQNAMMAMRAWCFSIWIISSRLTTCMDMLRVMRFCAQWRICCWRTSGTQTLPAGSAVTSSP